MTLSYHLTNQQARHLILLRQGLIGPKDYQGKTGTLNFIREIGSLQFDPIDICGRNADLTLLSRIAGYRKSDLKELLYTDRRLIDYFDKNLGIFPITEFQSFYYHKKWFQERSHSIDDIDTIRALITAAIKEKTYVAANDFDMNQKVDWDWGQNKLSRAALEYLYHSGELLIHHKDNTRKYYTLPEMVLSDLELVAPQNPFPSQQASYTWLVQRRISNVGLLWNKASDAWLGIPAFKAKDRKASFAELVAQNLLIEVIVEGLTVPLYLLTKDQHFLDAVLTTEHFKPRLEFIAPLDPLLWDRQLVRELFDFDYKWEIYTPVNQRRFGHYVLPILYGTQFIGRIELKNKRQERHLELTNYWLEAGINLTAALKGELNSTLKQMAEFNGCLTWDSFN